MWDDIKRLYADSWAFALALPILFSIPALIEFAQHVVEIDIGLYHDGIASAAAMDQRRLTLGFAKALALILPSYWFVRYMAGNRDAAAARRIARPAATLFGVQFGLRAILQWLTLFGPPISIVLGLDGHLGGYATFAVGVAGFVAGIYLTAWLVAWPLGNFHIGPIRSVSVMAGGFWRAVVYMIAGTIPLMFLHYALGYGAIGRPEWLVWIMMTVDAIVVGLLALTMAGSAYLGAMRAAERHGVALDGR